MKTSNDIYVNRQVRRWVQALQHISLVLAGHTPVQHRVLQHCDYSNLWPAWLPQDTSLVRTT